MFTSKAKSATLEWNPKVVSDGAREYKARLAIENTEACMSLKQRRRKTFIRLSIVQCYTPFFLFITDEGDKVSQNMLQQSFNSLIIYL
jgi:hypothetical protein